MRVSKSMREYASHRTYYRLTQLPVPVPGLIVEEKLRLGESMAASTSRHHASRASVPRIMTVCKKPTLSLRKRVKI